MILQREVLSAAKEQSSFCMEGREENSPGVWHSFPSDLQLNLGHERILVASLGAQEPDLCLSTAFLFNDNFTLQKTFTPKFRKPKT